MKTKIKRHSRSVLSVILAISMLVSCMMVGLIATDAANVTDQGTVGAAENTGSTVGASEDSESVGSGLHLLWGTNNKPSELTDIGATITQSGTTYTIVLPTGKIFNKGTNYYFALSSEKNRNGIFFSRDYYSGGSLSVSKDNSGKFLSAGEQTYNEPDINGTSQSYRMARVTFAEQVNTSITGITITVDSTARSYLFETTGSVNYNVTVSSGANGSVTAGTTTVNENGSATVSTNSTGISLTANPAPGYTFDKWTVSGTGASVDNPNSRSTTLKATAAGGTVTASFNASATTKKTIYYDNSTTKWTTPYAFAWTEGVANYLGEWPGSAMTLHKGKVWKIEVSDDAEQIIFSGKGSNKTGDLTIPTDGRNYYMNGTWTTYSESTSGNHYTATLGNTITGNANLYTNINATFYDYYTDHEYEGNWYSSIDAEGDGWVKQNNATNSIGNRNPYEKLNTSLSEYAAKTANNVTYPMYFGSYYWSNNYHAPSYTRASWNDGGGWINDSNSLGGTNKALTGLSGKTITNGNINHYKQGVTDENGVPMVLFDEDWLTSRDTSYTNQNALATIINSNFPVRKTTEDFYPNIYLDVSNATGWYDGNAVTWAHLWDDAGNTNDVHLTNGTNNICTIAASGYTHVKFVRCKSGTSTTSLDWNKIWNQTGDLEIQTDGRVKFKLSNNLQSGTWETYDSAEKESYNYYEFNSTGAKDNIYFDNLTGGSPVMQYGAGEGHGQKSGYNSKYGFYPFDKYTDKKRNGEWSKAYAKDQGFGMKLEIDFTLGENGKINGADQVFNFSGDDDLWVFVDDQLILDLGGDHAMTTGSINFAKRTVTASPEAVSIQTKMSAAPAIRNSSFDIALDNPNKIHKMTIFYMERGMHESNLKFGFSFSPVGNEFLTEKQVSDRNVNTGFGDAVMNAAKDDSFTFTHSTSSSVSGEYTPSANKQYVLNDAATTTDTTSAGTFDLKHGGTADFIDQFIKDTYFKITETPASANKFSYTPNLLVTDMVTNQTISPNSDGSYKFITTKAEPTDLDATRIEAFFTNTIDTQTLTVTKKLPTYYDPDTDFTVKVDVSLDGGTTYTAYPLTFTKNGTAGALTNEGTTTLKRNQSIVIAGIPKNAKVRVYEPAENMPNNYEFASYSVTKADNTAVSATKYENGCSFTLADNDTVTLNNSPYRYAITYKYQSRLYGEQTYSVSGVFTDEEHTSTNVDSKVSLKKAFLQKYAPYEDNFMKTLKLNFDKPDSNRYSGGTYTAVLTFNLGDITKPHALIKMPYAHGNEASGYAATKDSSGKVAAEANTQDVDVEADEYLGHFKVGGEYIEAPLEIYEGSTKKNFQYWTLSTLVTGGNGDFVANNYSTKLNYTAYEDYYIEAVYSEAARPSISDQATNTTITYLEDSRNQWNNGGGGSATNLPEGWLDHGDQIYVDFDLAFYDGDKLLQNSAESQGITTGLIIQKAGDLQADGDSSYHYNDATYTSQINALKGQENADAVKNFIMTEKQPTTGGKCVKLDIDTNDLDNKNRIEYFYGLSNKSISTGNPTKIKTYIYRAYSYITVNGNVTLSKPVYFNVYETATRGYDK